MKILRLGVEGVGKFATPTQITGFSAGVNILAVGNEAGKSTLFRAIRTGLFERHSSKKEDIQNLASQGLSLPVTINLSFEHQGAEYEIKKSFLKTPSSELWRDGQKIAQGSAADEELWSLLGMRPGAGRNLDEAAFGLLWVGQGHSFALPKPSDAASHVLNGIIQEEVGTLVGGKRAREVQQQIEKALDELGTIGTRGKQSQKLTIARHKLSEVEQELSKTTALLKQLEQDMGEVAQLQQELAQLSDPSRTQEMQDNLKKAQHELKQAQEAAALVKQLENQQRLSTHRLTEAQTVLQGLQERCKTIDQARQAVVQMQAELQGLTLDVQAVRQRYEGLQIERAKIDTEIEGFERDEQRFGAIEAVAAQLHALDGLRQQRQEWQARQTRWIKLSADLGQNLITEAMAQKGGALEHELIQARLRREARAAELTIEPGPKAGADLKLDGAAINAHQRLTVTRTIEITLGEVARIVIAPAAQEAEQGQKEQQALQRKVTAFLQQTGCDDLARVRQQRRERQMLEMEANFLKEDVERAGQSLETLTKRIEAIDLEIGKADAFIETSQQRWGPDLATQSQQVAQQREELLQKRQSAQQQRQKLDSTLKDQDRKRGDTVGRFNQLQGRLAERERQLQADLAGLPDDQREERLTSAQRRFEQARAEAQEKAAALEGQRLRTPHVDEIKKLEGRIARLTVSIDSNKQEVDQTKIKIANLEGRIDSTGGESSGETLGLGEKEEGLLQEQDLLRRQIEQIEGRIGVLHLLRSVVSDCYKEQKDRLNAPLLRHLQPFLSDLFQQAEVELGDGFAITGVRRRLQDVEKFERLSDGTQEQIAVLVRLALGAMLAEKQAAAPVILDDALVFSDDVRIEHMFDALTRAGQNQQVIVFTCRSRAFSSLGAHRLEIGHHPAPNL